MWSCCAKSSLSCVSSQGKEGEERRLIELPGTASLKSCAREPRRRVWWLTPESLPSEIDLASYREELRSEATRLVSLPKTTIPWYLRQQALLFLAAYDPARAPISDTITEPETQDYLELIGFLRGDGNRLQSTDFATHAVLARRAFVDQVRAIELTRPGLNPSWNQQLAQQDPSFLLELIEDATDAPLFDSLPMRIREDLCRASEDSEDDHITLVKAVLNSHPSGSLRNELSLLRFARAFLQEWQQHQLPPASDHARAGHAESRWRPNDC